MDTIRTGLRQVHFLVIPLLILIPFAVLLTVSHGIEGFFREQAPDGQLLYLLSKLAGICAFIVLTGQILMAVLGRVTGQVSWKAPGRSLHIVLGILLVGLILAHAGLFVAAASVRSGHLAIHLLLPDFSSGYYTAAVSLGVLALILFTVAVFSGVFAVQRSSAYLRGHRLVYLALLVVLVHATMIGSEIQSGWLQIFFLVAAISMITVLVVRAVLVKR